MLGKVAKNVSLAPWEEEHQQQQSHEEWLAGLSKRQYLTRGQWFHGYGRRVTVPNVEARKTIVTKQGRFFCSAQTNCCLSKSRSN